MTAPATPTPPQYTPGAIKVDAVSTKAVAIRTDIVTSNNFKDWGVMTVDRGGHYATWDDVAAWPDLALPSVAPAQLGGMGDLTATVAIAGEGVTVALAGDGELTAAVTTQRRGRKKG
jgi:hypothetical protein